MRRAVISLRVKVPVLSEQMTEVAPSVSTAGRRRITALRAAMRCTPIARVMVMTAGRPSGMTPTARATTAISASGQAKSRIEHGKREQHDRGGQGDPGEALAEPVDLAKQRRGEQLDALDQRADPADLGLCARRHDHARALTGGNQGARERHAQTIAERRDRRDGILLLLGRH